MKDYHFSFRGGFAKQDHYFLSSGATDRISGLLNAPFDPYGSYTFSYQIYFINAISMDIPHPEESPNYFGTLRFTKKVEKETSTYTAERIIHGVLNMNNSAKPYSVT